VDQSQITSDHPGLSNLNGIRLTGSDGVRYYYGGGVASAVIGYMQQISPDTLAHYKSLGYQGDERVGVTGLEASQEAILAGRQGGTLYVVGPDNNVISTLAESAAQPGLNITTTIDRSLQEQMEHTLMGPYRGAAVVLNRNDGEVLAMLSSPNYDSNLFNPDLFNNNYLSDLILNRQDQPLFNRAASGGYPLGSVFKIITMASGLESGLFTPDTTYHDDGYFTELPGFVGTDWTVEKDMKPQGTITLTQGFERSCNPYFWHIGYTVFQQDPNIVPDMAAAFGLGQPTGIGAIDEYAGVLPSPAAKKASTGEDWTGYDAVLQAIGQGMEVTPLQAADFAAAVGNGGSLYRPQLILSINQPSGEPMFAFSPVLRGLLPVKPGTLAAIQEAMRGVVKDPNGTAWSKFWVISDAIKIAGKTGTAQTDQENPDAWFVSYTYNESATKPDIAAAVVVENVGEGSTYAAPMVRRIMEIYYFGHPSARYPWESEFGMRATDTPVEGPPPENTPTDTPAP
jgi:penicillin-binding protein 2